LVTNTANAAPHPVVSSSPPYPITLRPKYISQHRFLKHPQFMFFYQYDRPNVTPIYMHHCHKYCLYALILLHFCSAKRKILLVKLSFRCEADQNHSFVGCDVEQL
jgi:hypothetical protein